MAHNPHSLADAFHYLSHEEVDCIQDVVRHLPPNPIVINIGSGSGTSGLSIITARPDVTLITIDIQDEDSPLGCLFAERTILNDAGYGDLWGKRWFQVHKDSKEVAKSWKKQRLTDTNGKSFNVEEMVDFVFIDGDHSYEGCAGDIKLWWKVLRKFGKMAIHDFDKIPAYYARNPNAPHTESHIDYVVKPYPGVDKSVRDILKGHYPMHRQVDTLIVFEKR